ncbi:uncharacterized protein LOC142566006 [Dermacentor variabilis]|uniref:uncharacterized protein LOC142566006 n=1 Tax=Dermacentor variabilis TaxID=34621 RepID=UPI003F5BA875
MPKLPLLLVQVLPWFFAVVSTANNRTEPGFFDVPQRGNDTAVCLLVNAHPSGVTSSLDNLEKDQPGIDFFRGHGSLPADNMPKSPLLLVQVLPWFFAVVSTANNRTEPGFFDVPQRGNDTAVRLLVNAHPSGVTSSLDNLEKDQPGIDFFRGHGSLPADNMPKSPLLLVQVLPWFFAVVSTANNRTEPGFFDVPQRGNDTAVRLLVNAHPSGVTSSLDNLEKDQPGIDFFRGHGSLPADNMPKSPLLLVQVSQLGNLPAYRSDDRFLLVLPCPQKCSAILSDCWSMLMLLLVSGDIEQNPGPKANEMLQVIIDRLDESDRKMDRIREEIAAVNAKTDKLQGILTMFEEMSNRINKLESVVQQQALKLIDYENRSRRNNLLVFGINESADETETKLREQVLDGIFDNTLGVPVRTVERIHRIGKAKPDKPRPIIMKFLDSREKDSVLKNCFKLKGTNVRVSQDYAKETAEIRRKLWKSAASDRSKGTKVKLIYDKLKIKDKMYTWDLTNDKRIPYGYKESRFGKEKQKKFEVAGCPPDPDGSTSSMVTPGSSPTS